MDVLRKFSLLLVLVLINALLTGCTLDIKFETIPSSAVSNPISTNVEYSSKVYRDYYSSSGHTEHTATDIGDGKILVVGGRKSSAGVFPTDSVEIFDIATKRWSAGPTYPVPVVGQTATKLADGTVLLVGGITFVDYSTSTTLNTVYIYNPSTNSLTQKTSMNVPRWKHTATLLANGKVLVTGGATTSGVTASTELYDPALDTWTVRASIGTAAYNHAATLLADGNRVYVTGGLMSGGATAITQAGILDPSANSWTAATALTQPRAYHSSTLLDDGRVLVAGGWYNNAGQNSAVIFNPTSGTYATATNMPETRYGQTATNVNGWVIMTGGRTNTANAYDSTLAYNSYTNAWVSLGTMTSARYGQSATVIDDTLYALGGSDIVGGGLGTGDILNLANLIDAVDYSGAALGLPSWTATANLAEGRMMHQMVVLKNGKVLAAGGAKYSVPVNSTSIYNPSTNLWSAGPDMTEARIFHTMTVLPSGKVIIAGGSTGAGAASTADIYDPDTNTITPITMPITRAYQMAAVLANGKLMLSGGVDNSMNILTSTDLYDETTGLWSTGAPRPSGGYYESISSLAGNKFFIYGPLGSYVYDATNNSWITTSASSVARMLHSASVLPNGKVLVAGGQDMGGVLQSSTEIYDPATDSWTSGASLPMTLAAHTAVTMNSGKIAVIGGQSTGAVFVNNVRFYDATTNQWTEGTPMYDTRNFHASVLMPNGRVLVYGGQSNIFGFLPFWEQVVDP